VAADYIDGLLTGLVPDSADGTLLWIQGGTALGPEPSGGRIKACDGGSRYGCPAVAIVTAYDSQSRRLCFTRAPCHERHAAACALPQGALADARLLIHEGCLFIICNI
jgi:hypothetical protein